jgi:predicted anti-sigma-YlaC factor YlaD
MSNMDCARAHEALEALGAGRWPDSCDDELRGHVTACADCRDLVAVAGAILEDRDAALQEATVPGSGQVWWRMQVRARREAARSAARAVTAVQTIAIACSLAIALAFLGASTISGLRTWLAAHLVDTLSFVPADLSGSSGIALSTASILLASAVFLTLGPIAVWFAVAKEE